jgi:hypothetical protein
MAELRATCNRLLSFPRATPAKYVGHAAKRQLAGFHRREWAQPHHRSLRELAQYFQTALERLVARGVRDTEVGVTPAKNSAGNY